MKKKVFLLLVFLLVATDLFGRARRFAIGPTVAVDYNYAFVNYDVNGGDVRVRATYPSLQVGLAIRLGRYNRSGILSRFNYVRSLDISVETNIADQENVPVREGASQQFFTGDLLYVVTVDKDIITGGGLAVQHALSPEVSGNTIGGNSYTAIGLGAMVGIYWTKSILTSLDVSLLPLAFGPRIDRLPSKALLIAGSINISAAYLF